MNVVDGRCAGYLRGGHMRYMMGLVARCGVGLVVASSAALAGPLQDCNNASWDRDRQIHGCTAIIRRDKKAAWAYSNRGAAYLNKGEHDSAVADYSEAIRLKPSDAAAHAWRGTAYYAKGDYD